MNIKILILLSLGHLVTDVSQGALPALLPFLKEALGLSYTAAGLVLLVSNMTSSIIQPLFGLVSDRQPKPFLIPVGILMASLGISFAGLAPNYPVLLLLVIFCGLGVAAFHPEGFKTAHFFIGRRKASGMSLFAVGGNLGFALGPFTLVFLVTHFTLKGTLFYLIPGLLMVATVIGLLSTFRYEHPTGEKKASPADRKGRSSYSLLTLLILIVTMRSWIQMGLVSYIPFYYINYLKGDPLLAGKMVTTFLVSGTIGTLIGAPLADRWGHKRFLTMTMAAATPLLFLFMRIEGWGVFPVLALTGFVLIATFSVTVVMAQDLLPGRLGVASGLMVGFAIGTGGLGVTLLGTVADTWGVPAALHLLAYMPIVGLILCFFLPAAAFHRRAIKVSS